MELSINFIVIFILAITIFMFAMIFLSQIFGQATHLKDITEEKLDSEIQSLACSGDQKVCTPVRLGLNSLKNPRPHRLEA